jgi:predicted Zn-dependent protease
MGKLLVIAAIVLAFILLLMPRRIPQLLRALGRSVRGAGQAGRELASGTEEPGSPLAQAEVKAGAILAARVLASMSPCGDRRLQEEVAALGERLAAFASRKQIPYRITVVESEEPNAFAVAGGQVFITRPLLALCEGDTDRAAGVLAHEIVHIDRRHAFHGLLAKAAAKAGTTLLLGGKGALLKRVAGVALEDLLSSGYRREQELEADLQGAALAQAAGYDPLGLARLLARLRAEEADGGGPLWKMLQYFSTHPPLGERIAALESRFGRMAAGEGEGRSGSSGSDATGTSRP